MADLIVISGSNRADSFNLKLANLLVSAAAEAGMTAELFAPEKLDLPLYNGDLEASAGLPAAVSELKEALASAKGIMITCPEYNGFMTPLLINAIDWSTRANNNLDLSGYMGKTVFIAAASPGGGGGGRAANHLKTMLSGIGAHVYPFPFTVATAHKAFNDDGTLADENSANGLNGMVAAFVDFTKKLG